MNKVIFPNKEFKIDLGNKLTLTKLMGEWTYFYKTDMSDPNTALIEIMMLASLLKNKEIPLVVDYIPYLRQDKKGENAFGFEVSSLLRDISGLRIITLVPHLATICLDFQKWSKEFFERGINKINDDNKNSIIVFPDFGAKERYVYAKENIFNDWDDEIIHENIKNTITITKKRNKNDGHLTFETITKKLDPKKDYIIIDDIVSKGGTLLGVKKLLEDAGAKNISVVVAHDEGTKPKGFKNNFKHFITKEDVYPELYKENE